MGTEVQPCSKQTPCVSEEAVYRPEEGVSAEPVCEAGAPEPEQAPAPKVPPKASFQTPSVFRNYNTNQGDKANAEPDPQEAAPSPKKDAAYDRLLGEAYEKVKAAPSKEKMERLTDELFARAGDDPKLFARLYTDLREGLEFYTSEGGFIVKDVGVRFLQEARARMKDDPAFVRWALGFGDQLGVENSRTVQDVSYALDAEAKKRPEVMEPILMRGFDPRDDNRRGQRIEQLRRDQPELFERLMASSDSFFSNACAFAPELVAGKHADAALKRNGALWSALPAKLEDAKRFELAVANNRSGEPLELKRPAPWLTGDMIEKAVRASPKMIRQLSREKGSCIAWKGRGSLEVPDPGRYYRVAVAQDSLAIRDVPVEERSSGLMALARKGDDPVVGFYDPAFLKQPPEERVAVARELVEADPKRYADLPSQYRGDPGVKMAALADAANVEQIWREGNLAREHVIRIMQHDGMKYRELTHGRAIYRHDPAVIEAALKQNAAVARFVPSEQEYDPRYRSILSADPRTRGKTELPQKIGFPERFYSERDFQKALESRQKLEAAIAADPVHPKRSDKPIALMLFPTADHNGAFRFSNPAHQRIKDGYDIAYYEVTSDEEFARIMNSYLPLLQAGDEVYLGGHGSKQTLSLSGSDPRYRSEGDFDQGQADVSLRDRGALMAQIPEERIPEGVTLILESCSNAEGGPEADNMAVMMYRDVFRKKWDVLAVMGPSNAYPLPAGDGGKPIVSSVSRTMHLLAHDGGVRTYWMNPLSWLVRSLGGHLEGIAQNAVDGAAKLLSLAGDAFVAPAMAQTPKGP